MKAAQIRSKFLKFFEEKGHTLVESASLVPSNDPTLMFTNAGMVPFKDVFTGVEKRAYTRATSSQKCVRAGGKHNDLENVGYTARHHTFFEMLGNFSFGDYFKEDAIKYAWEFSTEVLKFDKSKLYITVFETDDEAMEIWKKVSGFGEDRIFRLGEADNFWSMGDTGPCGPCSELFVDRGEKFGCDDPKCAVGCDCDRYMEFWNLVFMQYDRAADGTMKPLPKPSVDTGGGLERIASILQETDTNYEIDLFENILAKVVDLSGQKYVPGQESAFSFRVIADHARAVTFLIGDGVMPSNEGRGYVLRRIIRRAIRYGKNIGLEKPFLFKVCGVVIDEMISAYPSLGTSRSLIERAVKSEEEQFLKTLERGLNLLDSEIKKLKKGDKLNGEVAFKLYDTFGFPLDLTRIICEEQQSTVDEAGFEEAMKKQKEQSRKNWKGSGDAAVDTTFHELNEKFRADKTTLSFTGFTDTEATSPCVALIVREKGKEPKIVTEYDAGEKGSKSVIEAVFQTTPFYGEGGGQSGDHGRVSGAGFEADVIDCKKPIDGLIVAHLKPRFGKIKVGETYVQQTNLKLRQLSERNHTATHMLQWALVDVLGSHVKQAGSLVNPDQLRFDFTHFQGMTQEELAKVETMMNEKIFENASVGSKEMDKEEAVQSGATAIFGEKYGDKVRVVKVGEFSTELCGGTHVRNTSEINLFKIVSEGGIAAGVRRIVAYTSSTAVAFVNERFEESKGLRERFKATSTEDLYKKIDKLAASEKDALRKVEKMASNSMNLEIDSIIMGSKAKFKGVRLVVSHCESDPSGVKKLREMSDRIREKVSDAVVVLGMNDPEKNKSFVLAAIGRDAPKAFKANDIIKKIAVFIDGRGGGKPDMAQAGGTNLAGLEKALSEVEKVVEEVKSYVTVDS